MHLQWSKSGQVAVLLEVKFVTLGLEFVRGFLTRSRVIDARSREVTLCPDKDMLRHVHVAVTQADSLLLLGGESRAVTAKKVVVTTMTRDIIVDWCGVLWGCYCVAKREGLTQEF